MTSVPNTPLDPWTVDRIGARPGPLRRSDLDAFQLDRLDRTLALAATSRWGRDRLPACLGDLARLAELPFTTADDIRADPLGFVCGSQGRISRIVTLDTSGTTGPPKRVAFTADDQELTVDFFRVGMSTFTRPGDRVAILLPGETPGSVGDLLAAAVERLGGVPLRHGPVADADRSLRRLVDDGATVTVGVPTHLLALARHPSGKRPLVHSVLLSTDHLPGAIRTALETAWSCTVYDHWGMTETGLGGAVECGAHDGLHLREADLIAEIVDPASGAVLPAGAHGELVVTTITRTGMPLVRYRTGDLTSIDERRCVCGSLLRRIAPVRARRDRLVPIGHGAITMADLDDVLFAIDGVVGFHASVPAAARLDVLVRATGDLDLRAVTHTLRTALPALDGVDVLVNMAAQLPPAIGKRRIAVGPGMVSH